LDPPSNPGLQPIPGTPGLPSSVHSGPSPGCACPAEVTRSLWPVRNGPRFAPMNSLAKKSLVIAGATLLAVSVSAQVRNRVNVARYNAVVTNSLVGGTGGVITGPPPTSLSPVVVGTPVPVTPPSPPSSAGWDR
jgi:hypothetical protein